jgi:hypothetical protein
MNRKVLVIAVALMAVAMLAVPISAVYATKPTHVEGTFVPTPGSTYVTRQADDNFIVEIEGPHAWTGSFEGTSYSEGRWVWHKFFDSDPENDFLRVHVVYTLNVEYDDLTGTLTILATGGTWTIISGTGDLANLHGQGTTYAIDPSIFLMGYEGQVHFDP